MTDQPRAGRVVRQQCEGCGTTFVPLGAGRPRKYCTAACRQRAWALRAAARTLQTGADPRPTTVERVVEVERERLVPAEPAVASPSAPPRYAAPIDVGGWLNMLTMLREQLQDDRNPIVREHWKHRHLYDALVRDVTALGKAHPGGLDALSNPRSRR